MFPEYNKAVVSLAGYCSSKEMAENICKSWKMSNEETALILHLMESLPDLSYEHIYAEVARKPESRSLWINYLARWGRFREYEMLRSEVFPVLPISGKDLIAAGYKPGPVFSDLLFYAWQEFISSDYTATKEDLMEYLVADVYPLFK